MKIKHLPKHVYEKIKAGEVIEDYTSVVSELIDNSIDAGASRIDVIIELEKDKIIVKDDGYGMDKEDLLICFLPHTTSKINDFEDIFKISTLGFRGEALSSIAKVSQLKILSSQSDIGHYIVVENEEIIKEGDIAFSKGTVVEVSNLFYNYPARRKFISGKKNQVNMIKEIIKIKSIPYPEIGFTLKIGEDTVMILNPSEFEDRIVGVTGIKDYKIFNRSFKDFTIKGIITTPFETYSTTSTLYFYVNNRHISKKSFYGTLKNSLRDLIPSSNYPAGAVFFYISPEFIDPNIHPAKKDIKINNESVILSSFYNLMREIFSSRSKIEDNSEPTKSFDSHSGISFEKSTDVSLLTNDSVLFEEEGKKTNYKYLGIVLDTYIICETEEGILFIDIHAAHERLRYESFRNKIDNLDIIALLTPDILSLDYKKFTILEEKKEYVNRLGFDFEIFGENSILMRKIPSFYKGDEWKEDFLNILQRLESSNITYSDIKEEYLKTASCRGSYMSGDRINDSEAKLLIKTILDKKISFTCPHGRPIYFLMTKDEIKTRFLRT